VNDKVPYAQRARSFETRNTITLGVFTKAGASGNKQLRIGLWGNVMSTRAQKSAVRRFVLRCSALMLGFMTTASAWSACPKLLMEGGVFMRKQTTPEQAAYWGKTIGVQGFMMNEIMSDWNTDVGTDSNSDLWKLVRQFQSVYSQNGVTDNFIKVGIHSTRDWHNSWQNEAAVKNFAHAATLAKYAGFKGVVVDLEPYQPAWGGAAGGQELAGIVQQEGRAIAMAMHEAYPDMTLIVMQDALHNAYQLHRPMAPISNLQATPPDSSRRYHGGYALSVPFLRGLLSVEWAHVVVATEETYRDPNIVNVVQQTTKNYMAFLGDDAVWTNISTAPGLWPLGLSIWDKSPRETPAQFKKQLQDAFSASQEYVWIYGYGSAWQTNGPYGSGPVTANFQQYVDAVHQVLASCGGSGSVGGGSSPATNSQSSVFAPPRANEEPEQSVSRSRYADPVQPADTMQPVGTLPKITPLRPAGTGNARTEIP